MPLLTLPNSKLVGGDREGGRKARVGKCLVDRWWELSSSGLRGVKGGFHWSAMWIPWRAPNMEQDVLSIQSCGSCSQSLGFRPPPLASFRSGLFVLPESTTDPLLSQGKQVSQICCGWKAISFQTQCLSLSHFSCLRHKLDSIAGGPQLQGTHNQFSEFSPRSHFPLTWVEKKTSYTFLCGAYV